MALLAQCKNLGQRMPGDKAGEGSRNLCDMFFKKLKYFNTPSEY